MSRIRTIKPEIWTDAKIVQLPYEARLFFIGMWNFVDDRGCVEDEPETLRFEIMPADAIDAGAITDLLVAAGLVERFATEDGGFLRVAHFDRHQRIQHPSRSRFYDEGSPGYRKVGIPNQVRQDVAAKYGCKPGGTTKATCYYCGSPGLIVWWNRRDGRPSSWVSFSGLELDHFIPEAASPGAAAEAAEIVLACRPCNRGKGHWRLGSEVISGKLRGSHEGAGALTPEGKGREGKGKEGTSSVSAGADLAASSPETQVFATWRKVTGHHNARFGDERRRKVRARLREYPLEDVLDAVRGVTLSAHHMGQNDTGTVYDDLELICRDGQHLEKFRELYRNPGQQRQPDNAVDRQVLRLAGAPRIGA